jgi:hypothetical protein
MKNLSKIGAFKRNQLYHLMDEVTVNTDAVQTGLTNFPIKETSSWPSPLTRVTIQDNVAFIPVAYSFSTVADLTLLDSRDETFSLPAEKTELENRLTQLSVQSLAISSMMFHLKLIIRSLDKKQFPTDLVSYTALTSALRTLLGNDKRVLLPAVQLLENSPLTEAVQVRDPSSLPEAVLEIISKIPATNKLSQLTAYQLYVFPISRTGYIQGLKWKALNISSTMMLVNTERSRIYQYNPLDTKCSITTENFCHICTIPSTMISLKDQCINNLFFRKSDGNCSYQEQDPPAAAFYQLSEQQVAIIDSTPGSLVQKCGNNNAVFPMHPSSILLLNNTCDYELLDQGNNIPFLPALLPKNLKLYGTNLIRNIPNIVEDLNTVQQHFKRYGYIYVIAVGSVLLLLISILLCAICCRCQRSRTRRRRQASRETSTHTSLHDQTSENRLLLRTFAPFASTLPTRLHSPRITETARGLMIETV